MSICVMKPERRDEHTGSIGVLALASFGVYFLARMVKY